MSTIYSLWPTEIGRQKLATALAEQTRVRLAAIALGDGAGEAAAPDPAAVALVREVWRSGENDMFRVSRHPEHPAWVVAETVVPMTGAGFVIREAGVFDDAGELFAYGNLPEICRPALNDGVGMEVTLELIIAVEAAEAALIVLESRQRVFDLCGFSLSAGVELMLTLSENGDDLAVASFQRLSLMPARTAFSVTDFELTATLPL
jgi:phage-related tail fiber protein